MDKFRLKLLENQSFYLKKFRVHNRGVTISILKVKFRSKWSKFVSDFSGAGFAFSDGNFLITEHYRKIGKRDTCTLPASE
jgi:hypothetical protein